MSEQIDDLLRRIDKELAESKLPPEAVLAMSAFRYTGHTGAEEIPD